MYVKHLKLYIILLHFAQSSLSTQTHFLLHQVLLFSKTQLHVPSGSPFLTAPYLGHKAASLIYFYNTCITSITILITAVL